MKKGQIKAKFLSKKLLKELNSDLQFHKMFEFCPDLSKTGLKIYYFCQHLKKAKKMAKWPNHFISGKQFQKRPDGNPAECAQKAN
jgi:hypothetical protein